MTSKNEPQDYVSFRDGAALLVERGLAKTMSPQGLRYIARSRADYWPFGEGHTKDGVQRVPYLSTGGMHLMLTSVFLDYFEKHPPTGRGPNTKPWSKS